MQIDTVGMGTVSGRTDTMIYSPVVGDDFAESQLLELTVTPDPGWEFSLWSGALTGNNTRPFLFPSRDSRVTATFKPASVFATVDDFNTASWVGGVGWSGAWTSSGVATTSDAVAELRGPSAEMTRTLGVPLSAATFSFGFDLDRTGGNDVASAEVFNGVWQTVWTKTSRGTDTDGSINMETSGSISLNGTITRVRFSLKGNGASDTFLIDDVTITGKPLILTVSASRYEPCLPPLRVSSDVSSPQLPLSVGAETYCTLFFQETILIGPFRFSF